MQYVVVYRWRNTDERVEIHIQDEESIYAIGVGKYRYLELE